MDFERRTKDIKLYIHCQTECCELDFVGSGISRRVPAVYTVLDLFQSFTGAVIQGMQRLV